MEYLKHLINVPSDFQCFSDGEQMVLTGVLILEKEKYRLHGRINPCDLSKLNDHFCWHIVGTIAHMPVTLIDSLLLSSSHSYGSEFSFVMFDPSEIIVGCNYNHDLQIVKASSEIMSLNWFFSSPPFELVFDRSYPVKYNDNNSIIAQNGDEKIVIGCNIGFNQTPHELAMISHPFIEYTFSSPVSVRTAISKLASIRNLLSFFADGYIPLGKISLYIPKEQSKNIVSPDYELYFNHKEDIPPQEEHFLISSSCVATNFEDIWHQWKDFYKNDLHIPTLFYEIICNRSTPINCFLNLTQALEIYSTHYRQKEAAALTATDGNDHRNVSLKYRIQDLLLLTSTYTKLSSTEIEQIARVISEARNFYTHYSKKRYPEPTFEDIWAASNLLRYVLLAIVYQRVGIDDSHIQACRNRSTYSELDRHIKQILLRHNIISQTK